MPCYKITVLPGDFIGPEVTAAATAVLEAAAAKFGFFLEWSERLIGGAAIDAVGEPLPKATIDACKSADAVLLGAVGGAADGNRWDGLPGALRPEAGLLRIRQALGLYANLRPVKVFQPLRAASPLKGSALSGTLDLLIVRELTGGIYFGQRGRFEENGVAGAFDTERYTEPEIRRVAKTAFSLAMKRSRRLTSVDKANVLESSRLWREVMLDTAKGFPEVSLTHLYVDNCAMQLIKNPAQFDVLVMSNMFGDILSDEASMLSGSLGMLPSASLAEGSFGLYEPAHGSAPDIAGKGIANPLAAILSAGMLLRYSLGEKAAAEAVETAVEQALAMARTKDIAVPDLPVVGTKEMAALVIRLL
jgi:3-isopropylmalate dehydrogenase